MNDLVYRLRHMPSSINDALRTMDEAADRIEALEKECFALAALQPPADTGQLGAEVSGPLPGLVEILRSTANDCENMERWATPELAPLLRRAADVIEGQP